MNGRWIRSFWVSAGKVRARLPLQTTALEKCPDSCRSAYKNGDGCSERNGLPRLQDDSKIIIRQ